jgi:hypothetical protein
MASHYKIRRKYRESIQVYPIPLRDNLKINNVNNVDILSISILNFSGQKVLEFEPNSIDLNLSALRQGIYLLRMGYKNGEIGKKILIE